MKIQKKDSTIEIISERSKVNFDTVSSKVYVDDLDINFPGEYEKGGILLEVKEYQEKLFYNFSIDGKTLVIITEDQFEQKEEILTFFGDVDVLIIIGSKNAAKIFENIEARIVVAYGEARDLFLNTLGQDTIEEVDSYKVKNELPTDDSIFVKLA